MAGRQVTPSFTEIVVYLCAIVLILVLGCTRGACVKEETATHALKSQGYSNIVITDHAFLAVGLRGCGEDDAARFTAIATNPAGEPTKVYVCAGWLFKSTTIRVPE